ncbi:MAG: hypothetical protein ACRCYO_01470 [Bacteroidia bacterium]
MKVEFRQLFKVDFAHGFYTNGKCADFTVTPTTDTQFVLRQHQSMFRVEDACIKVVSKLKADKSGPEILFRDGTVLSFGIQLNRPEVYNFTNPAELPAKGHVLLFTNYSRTKTSGYLPLRVQQVRLSGPVVFHEIVTKLAVKLILRNRNNVVLGVANYPEQSHTVEHNFSLQELPAGIYTVDETTASGTQITTYYVDADLARKPLFGILRIENSSAYPFVYDGTDAYKISFTPASGTWKYYVVVLRTATVTQYEIQDLGSNSYGSRPGPIMFNRIATIPATDKMPAMLETDLKRVILFESRFPITLSEKPRPRLQLQRRTSPTAVTAIQANLQNPNTNTQSIIIEENPVTLPAKQWLNLIVHT